MEGKVPLCVCTGIHYEHSWWYLVLYDAIAAEVDLEKFLHTTPLCVRGSEGTCMVPCIHAHKFCLGFCIINDVYN